MLIPKTSKTAEISVKRSRFIGKAESCSSPEEAKVLVDRRREEFPDSTHVVYAFVLGPEKSRTLGMSDDGEPKGTAGRPVLEVLKGSGITNLLVTVVRYFGGTKLGTGGLVRAYTEAAKRVLEDLPVGKLVRTLRFTLSLSYELYEQARRMFEETEVVLSSEEFTTEVTLEGELPEGNFPSLREGILAISKGEVEPRPV